MEDEDLGELERRGEPRGLTDTAYPGTEPEPCDNLCELNPGDNLKISVGLGLLLLELSD